jgi:outer membrane protein assembly factor BamD (BamD/ComL family)
MKTTLCTLALLAGTFSSAIPAWSADSDTKEEALYTEGTRAINDGRWQEAESLFASVVSQHGQRSEGALYWEAYALNKEGKQEEALRTCAQLRQTYPRGRWIDECGALEIEIRGKSDHPLPPQQEQNEELKLLALNSLMQQDPARALPIIQQILTSDKSDKLKTRALFVLAQDSSPQAQQIVDQSARNDHDPNLQRKAIQMLAISRGKQAAPTLAEVYRHTSNEQVKKSILQTYLVIGTPDPLIEAASHESNPDLVRTAVQTLGAMGGTAQLATLYHNTSNPQIKADILNGLIPSGPKGAEMLSTIASTEQESWRGGRTIHGALVGCDVPEESGHRHEESDRAGAVHRRRQSRPRRISPRRKGPCGEEGNRAATQHDAQ